MRDVLPTLPRVREVVEATGLPKTAIYDAIAKGELPVYRFGKSVPGGRGPAGLRLDPRDVARWIASRKEVSR